MPCDCHLHLTRLVSPAFNALLGLLACGNRFFETVLAGCICCQNPCKQHVVGGGDLRTA